MKYGSVFEIIGPIMVGPSSSHTAGSVRIGRMARELFGRPIRTLHIQFYGSFAETYQGHGTDIAIIAGALGMDTGDPLIPLSRRLASEQGLEVEIVCESEIPAHPNTARLILSDPDEIMILTGISIGGGHARITEWNGFELNLTGEAPTVLIQHQDVYGTITAVTEVISAHHIPCDQVISAMNQIGHAMPESLRETARGGLAATAEGQAIRQRLFIG